MLIKLINCLITLFSLFPMLVVFDLLKIKRFDRNTKNDVYDNEIHKLLTLSCILIFS